MQLIFSNLYASDLSNPKRACQKGKGKTTRQKGLETYNWKQFA